MKTLLSAEATGVLGALSLLGSLRVLDPAGLELVPWGFAAVVGGRLVLTDSGAAYAKTLRKRTNRTAPKERGRAKRQSRPDEHSRH